MHGFLGSEVKICRKNSKHITHDNSPATFGGARFGIGGIASDSSGGNAGIIGEGADDSADAETPAIFGDDIGLPPAATAAKLSGSVEFLRLLARLLLPE